MVENNIKIYQKWNLTEIFKELENDINLKYRRYVIVQPQEYFFDNVYFFTKINNLLELNNSFLKIYIGSEFPSNISYNRITFIRWDSIDYFSKSLGFYTHINSNWSEKVRFYEYLKNFPPVKHYTSLINIKDGRFWRTYIVNELYKNNLIDYGNFSFRFSDTELINFKKINNLYIDYPFKNYGVKNIVLDSWSAKNEVFNNNIKIENMSQIDETFYLRGDGLFSESDSTVLQANNICDLEYMICAFDIVVETLYDYFFVTEKTLRPIDAKKPFLVFSGQYFHKNLKEKYGFNLFDNIIDYSFDDEENTTIRWQKLIQELVKLKQFSPIDIKKMTIKEVSHNYEVLLNIRKNNASNIPPDYIKYNNKHFYYYKSKIKYDKII